MTDKTLGAYKRHEKHDAADFARAEFARHRIDKEVAAAGGSSVSAPWVCFGRTISDEGMAAGGWSPVLECPDPDEHNMWGKATPDQGTEAWWLARYEEAQTRAEKAEKERDQWKREADGANADLADLRAAESRPLTPDAITDEMVRRAKAELEARAGGDYYPETLEAVLTAALTEPPARPEGAEEIERLIETSPWHLAGSCSAEADWLAEHGVRVVTEDGGER